MFSDFGLMLPYEILMIVIPTGTSFIIHQLIAGNNMCFVRNIPQSKLYFIHMYI